MEIANSCGRDKQRGKSPKRGSPQRQAGQRMNRNPDSKFRVGKYEAKYDRYTPLNAPRSQIWKEVALAEMRRVERPRPVFNKAGIDQSRFCAFHNGPGHTTDQCWDLRDAIEKFIREGKLQQYVIKMQGWKGNKRKVNGPGQTSNPDKKQQMDQRKKALDANDEFPEAEYECNVISGAIGGGGDTISQRKRYLKEVLNVRHESKFKGVSSRPKLPMLYFSEEDMKGVVQGHEDGLLITGTLVNCRVKKIFVDNGSSVDIILWDAFKKMNLDEEDLKPCKTDLIGFNGLNTSPKGYIDLRLTLGTKEAFKSDRVRFIVADFPSQYNIILGRPTIHSWDMLVSTKHQKVKMLSDKSEVITVCGDQQESRRCYFDTVQGGEGQYESRSRTENRKDSGRPGKNVHIVELDMRDDTDIMRPEPGSEVDDFQLGEELWQVTKIGRSINPEVKARLKEFLKKNQDVFAWKAAEIPGIDSGFCCHKLSIYPGSTPVAQKKRRLGPERKLALEDHVKELLEAGFI